MKLEENYTLHFKVSSGTDYGKITVPKGTKVSHQTALGIDENYHFVNEYNWIDENYPRIAHMLKSDVHNYGLDVPKEYISKYRKKATNEVWLIQKKGYVGNSLLWWRKNDRGYTTNLKDAKEFSGQESFEICARMGSNKIRHEKCQVLKCAELHINSENKKWHEYKKQE